MREEYNEEYGNPIPQHSNWSPFAEAYNIGMLDLDSFARDMGYDDFYDLDISISPRSLYARNPRRFCQALRRNSLKAKSLSDQQIAQRMRNLGYEPADRKDTYINPEVQKFIDKGFTKKEAIDAYISGYKIRN